MLARPQLPAEAPAGDLGPIEVLLLGPVEVRRAGEALALGGSRPRALLTLLCLHRGTVVSADRIVHELWGEAPPATARHMVEVYVSRLRKLVGGAVLTRSPGYLLEVSPEHVDLARFERLCAEGRDALAGGDPDSAAARLVEALALWRGPALADFAYEPFAQAEIARLEELRLGAEEERIEAELALGRGTELVAELETLVAAAPLREKRQAHHMLALYRAGRQADALSAYQRARRAFVEELGIEPGPELRELERAILAQDERLLALRPPSKRAGAPTPESRRIVTVVLAELVGPKGGVEDPETSRTLSGLTLEHLRETVARYGGSADELPDGTALAVFGNPVAHEDDCVRALRAADELRTLGLVSRVGIETGEVIAAPDIPARGAVVRAAGRLKEAAKAGEIVVGETTGELTTGAARVEALRSRGLRGWRLVEISRGVPSRPLRLDVPLVGRVRELDDLCETFAHVVADRRPRLVTVPGEPGIGKSRLARELRNAVASEAQVLVGRCLAYGEGMTYWPLREIVRQAAGEESRDAVLRLLAGEEAAEVIAERIASVLGDTESAYPVEEIRWAAHRLLERLARERPLLIVIEDAHWAESTFLDLVEYVVAAGRQAPMLLLCLARPEFLEEHPRFGADAIVIERLSDEASHELLTLLEPGLADGEDARGQIVETASGNPLFLEQLVAFTSESRGRERAGIIPITLRSLLAARLDRLGPGERAVVERSAVVGPEFWAGAVAELLPPGARPTLARHLEALARKGLIETDASPAPFERAFRFRHVLIQEAAYRALPKARRAELHERLADWLDDASTDFLGERDQTVGYHLEQAYRYREELGLFDGHESLARRAGEVLSASGRRAHGRQDYFAATNLLFRAVSLVPQDDELRFSVLPELGESLFWLGRYSEASTTLAEAVDAARLAGDRGLEWHALLINSKLEAHVSPGAGRLTNEELEQRGREALVVFAELGDARGQAKAGLFIGKALHWQFRNQEAVHALEEALAHARLAGDEALEAECAAVLARPLIDGPTPVIHAIDRVEQLLATASNRVFLLEGECLINLANLYVKQERFDEARVCIERARTLADELGSQVHSATLAAFGAAVVERACGHFEGAEVELRRGYKILERLGEKGMRSTVAVNLADLLVGQGRLAEAEDFLRITEATASSDDLASQVPLRLLRARILARRGGPNEAEGLVREALSLLVGTDDLEVRASALLSLAGLLRETGRNDEALSAAKEARQLCKQKGNAVLEREARNLVQELAAL